MHKPGSIETERDKEIQRGDRLDTIWRRGIAAPIKDFSNPPLYNPAFGTTGNYGN
jgi:hypothetical protein